jgi:hypothetical protein
VLVDVIRLVTVGGVICVVVMVCVVVLLVLILVVISVRVVVVVRVEALYKPVLLVSIRVFPRSPPFFKIGMGLIELT